MGIDNKFSIRRTAMKYKKFIEGIICLIIRSYLWLFFILSISCFFIAGRSFEKQSYGEFIWYIGGGSIAYMLYWLSLKKLCLFVKARSLCKSINTATIDNSISMRRHPLVDPVKLMDG